jgi:hypothetical protein
MSKGKAFTNEFVMGFGFLSGLWVYAGIDPEGAVLGALATLVPSAGPLLLILSIVGPLVSLAGAYALGGMLGLLAVAFAFFGGMFITKGAGIWLLLIALGLGYAAPYAYMTVEEFVDLFRS